MNRDNLKSQWLQLKTRVREHWVKLTDDDLAQIQGDAEVLLGRLQERYGRTLEAVAKELDDWLVLQEAERAVAKAEDARADEAKASA